MTHPYVLSGPAGLFVGLIWTNDQGAYYGHSMKLDDAYRFGTVVEACAVLALLRNCRPNITLRVMEVVPNVGYTLQEVV